MTFLGASPCLEIPAPLMWWNNGSRIGLSFHAGAQAKWERVHVDQYDYSNHFGYCLVGWL